MITETRWTLAFCAVALVVVAVSTAQADEVSNYYYSYFDQQRPLGLDYARFAVLTVDTNTGVSPADRLARYGVDAKSLQPSAVEGWITAGTPQDIRSAAGVEALVASVADSKDLTFVSPVFIDSRSQPLIITQHLLVGFHEDIAPQAAERILDDRVNGVIEERDFAGLAGVYRVRAASKNGFEVLDLANALAKLPEVKFAESDAIIRAELSLIPNDPRFSEQWALNQANDQDMDAPEAWDITTGDDSIIVVVMDSGIQQDHPDLHQIPGQDFTGHGTPGGGPYNQCDQHATTVAGCVSAVINNSTGVVGVAPDCVVTSAKIGTGIWFLICLPFIESQPSYVADALDWAVTIGARVTNSSFGFEESSTMTTAYNNAHANGVINFAATGNGGGSSISYPASRGSVVAVGALNSSGNRASFSQYGTGIAFSAPGEGILTTDQTGGDGYEDGDYVTADGTSYSSPYGAGVAALVLSQAPELTPGEVEQVLNETCVDLGATGYDTTYGWGFVNAYNAVAAVSVPGDYNHDGEVDLTDFVHWDDCMTGPDNGPYDAGCGPFDFEGDEDVDLEDFAAFQKAFAE